MTYLHDFVTARKAMREKIAPKLIAALMPTLDRLGATYEATKEGMSVDSKGAIDALIVSLPAGTLPDGYVMRIDFVPVSQTAWKAPDGTEVKGPGF